MVATGPASEAEEREITCAVAVITVFGILATRVYPYAPGLGMRRLYGAATWLLPAARDSGETRDRRPCVEPAPSDTKCSCNPLPV